MAAPNLTQIQAQQRAAHLEVESYVVELDLTDGLGQPGERTFRSTSTVRFGTSRPGSDTWIEIVADAVLSATLNGVELDVSGYREEDGIALTGLAETNEVTVTANCRYMNTGEGVHRFVDPVDKGVYLYTQFETADAKLMFACFDQPDLKATYQLTVTAPESWTVIGNAAEVSADPADHGAVRHTFETTERMSTYLVAMVAGPYARWTDVYTDEQTTIPLGLYCRASLAEYMDDERLFTQTKQGFGFFHEAFGVPYPFGKYDQVFVPEFNAGAMENAGCVTFLEDYVFRSRVTRYSYERRCETVLHEMAHMWFGDLVTMRWWDDLWLNESFATFASVLAQASATEYEHAWTSFANIEKSWAYRQDQLPSTHPIAADIPDLEAVEVNFDGITYAKGASVLKQLVAYVGLENFLAGLRVYFKRHAWGNATLTDLLAALQEASGRDLSWWGAQWLQTTGLNSLRPSFEVDDDGRFTRFTVLQGGAKPGVGELRTHRIAIGVYDDDPDADGPARLVRTHRVEVDVDGASTEVAELVGVPRGKLVLVNDDDLTYCTMRLDEGSLVALIDRIGDIAESLPRTLCWSAAWEMTREAELKARDFVSLVCHGVAAESEVGVVQRLLMQAQVAISSYSDQSCAPAYWQRFTERVRELALAAEPGSDHQLAFVNSLGGAVLDDATLDLLAGWLDGSAPLPGLTVDADLRWRLLLALVAHGRLGEAEIDAELQRDPTAAGGRHAERAKALRPTAAAKTEAWRRAVHDDELPNAVNEAIIAGFSHPGQKPLLAAYGEQYFAVVAEVWERRSSERAQSVVLGLYPSWAVSPETVAASDDFLAGDHPPALHRLVSEGRAGIVRALAAQEFDKDVVRS